MYRSVKDNVTVKWVAKSVVFSLILCQFTSGAHAAVDILPYLKSNVPTKGSSQPTVKGAPHFGDLGKRECGTGPILDVACLGSAIQVPTQTEFSDFQKQTSERTAALEQSIQKSNTTTDLKLERNQAELYDKVSNTYKDMMKDESFRKFVLSIVNEELDRRAREGSR